MSLANKLIHPKLVTTLDEYNNALAQSTGGMTLLQHYAGLAWTQDEIDSVTGYSVTSCAAFIGVKTEDYRPEIHYRIATSKARIVLAKALIAELEKEGGV